MIVKKFLKGFMAAALAVTMAVTPVSSVKAAEVTVTSGASTYTFSQEPVAAFVVTGFNGWRPFTLYCISEGTQIHSNSQIGDGYWRANRIAYDGDEYGFGNMEDTYSESEYNQSWKGGAFRDAYAGRCMYMYGVYHSNDPDVDERWYHSKSIESDEIFVVSTDSWWDNEVFDITVIPEVFALSGASAVQIPVADALAMDNANIQLDTANTQTAEAQAQAAQAEALAAQQAAEAQAQAEALAAQATQAEAQQAAEAAAQAQAEAQQAAAQVQPQPSITSASQGTYTVEANDNLCKIAQKVYGDMKAWREIYKANPTIKDDYVIYKGQVLVIPAR